SSAEVVTLNHRSINIIKVSNNSQINFYNMSAVPISSKPILFLLKSPEITVNGNTSFNTDKYLNSTLDQLGDSIPRQIDGQLKVKLGFVDHYPQPYEKGISTRYLTYLQSMASVARIHQPIEIINLPGDISPLAKQYGLRIPLNEALHTVSHIILLVSLVIVTVIGSFIMWPKIKKAQISR